MRQGTSPLPGSPQTTHTRACIHMVPRQRRIQPLVSQLAAVHAPLAAAALPPEPPVSLQQVHPQQRAG